MASLTQWDLIAECRRLRAKIARVEERCDDMDRVFTAVTPYARGVHFATKMLRWVASDEYPRNNPLDADTEPNNADGSDNA